MPFNVHEFQANGLRLGGARPNQFEVIMTFPFQANNAERFRYVCRAASIPPAVIDEAPAYWFGRAIKYAGDRTFPDWETTIYNDEDFALRVLFENWSNRINTLISNRMDPSVYPVGYKVDAEVRQFGKDGRVIRSYIFEGLWPKIVDTMPVDWSAQNQLQEFTVTFAYDLWRPNNAAGLGNLDGSYSPILPGDGTEDLSPLS